MGFFRASERTTKYHKKNIELGQRKTLIKKTNKMFFLHSPRIHVKLRVFGILRREKSPFTTCYNMKNLNKNVRTSVRPFMICLHLENGNHGMHVFQYNMQN